MKLGGAFLVLEHMLATSLTLPIEMLRAAEGAAFVKDRNALKLNLASVGTSLEAVNTQSGFKFQPDYLITDIEHTDMLIIPALWRNPQPLIKRNPDIVQWLKDLNEQGTTIIGVGTGCCFMAEAGILDGKAATTHWHYFEQFQKRYPLVDLKRQYFITQASNVYCAASVNAVADLTVHFIHRAYGKDIANHVQQNFSHEIRKDYAKTSYYSDADHPSSQYMDDKHRYHPDEEIVQMQIYMHDHYTREINLQALAERHGMSARTFNRRFKDALGKTPLRYLQEVRVDMAKDLLQTSNLSIAEIAFRVGYRDVAYFSSLFKKHLGSTPKDYRLVVRRKLFSPKVC